MNFKWKIASNQKQQQYLQKQIESGKIGHAYLFTGQANTLKTELAKVFIKSLFCTFTTKPCGKCDNCRQIKKGIHPDYHYLEPDNDKISIKDIRKLIRYLSRKSFSKETFKAVLVDQADKMNLQSANALLKTLEEPGKKQVIILIANDTQKLPKTILSRCQILRFLPDDKIEMNKKYQEDINWSLDFFKNKKVSNKLQLLDKKFKKIDKAKLIKIINLWIIIYRDLLLIKNNQNDLVINTFALDDLNLIAEKCNVEDIKNFVQKIERVNNLNGNINAKLWLENLIINN